MKRFIISIVSLFVVVFFVEGQNVTVTSAFDSSRIYIGDQIRFK